MKAFCVRSLEKRDSLSILFIKFKDLVDRLVGVNNFLVLSKYHAIVESLEDAVEHGENLFHIRFLDVVVSLNGDVYS